jgi:SnoaL-like polyketide cyclase
MIVMAQHKNILPMLVMCLALATTPVSARAPASRLNPQTWTWPSSASDPQVRESIINGRYTQEELRNIRIQLEALSMPPIIDAAHPADAPILIGPPPGVKFKGRGFRGLEAPFGGQGYLYGSIPDRTNVIQSILAKGDRVWVDWLIKGHQGGTMFGFPPSGKALEVREIAMLRYRDGVLIEADYWGDDLGLYRQLGGQVTFPGR